jgi:hypothetical protein
MNVGKMMKMRRTFIDPCSSPARWRWRDRGAVGGEGSFHTHEGRGRLDHRIKNVVMAMLPATPRDDHRSLVNLDRRGVIHLWMETLKVVDCIDKPLKIYCDNKPAIFYAHNNNSSKATTPIEVKYYVVKDKI